MWRSRASGLFIAAAGAAILAFLWSQVTDRSGDYLFIYRIGIPGVLLLTGLGALAVVFGAHLFCAPTSALRRWIPRRR